MKKFCTDATKARFHHKYVEIMHLPYAITMWELLQATTESLPFQCLDL